jgi:hypothetical protein
MVHGEQETLCVELDTVKVIKKTGSLKWLGHFFRMQELVLAERHWTG